MRATIAREMIVTIRLAVFGFQPLLAPYEVRAALTACPPSSGYSGSALKIAKLKLTNHSQKNRFAMMYVAPPRGEV